MGSGIENQADQTNLLQSWLRRLLLRQKLTSRKKLLQNRPMAGEGIDYIWSYDTIIPNNTIKVFLVPKWSGYSAP